MNPAWPRGSVPMVQSRGRQPVRHAGFTLLELLVVLAIIGLALSVVIPNFAASSATELRSAARMVAAGLRGAREEALSRQQPVALSLDLDAYTMGLDPGGPTAEGGPPARQLPDTLRYKLFVARSELFGERSGRIRFFPDGSSTGGRVTLSTGALEMLVDVDWLTGQIRVLRPEELPPGSEAGAAVASSADGESS